VMKNPERNHILSVFRIAGLDGLTVSQIAKIFFLVDREWLSIPMFFWESGGYGPYSKDVFPIINELVESKHLRCYRENPGLSQPDRTIFYQITQLGMDDWGENQTEDPAFRSTVKGIIMLVRSMGFKELFCYVAKRYPEYNGNLIFEGWGN